MDVGRFYGVQSGVRHVTHQRIAVYVKALCTRYAGMGFTPREEWVAEQTMQGLHLLLAVEAFLALASQEIRDSL